MVKTLHFKELCKFKKIEERFEILGKKLEEKIDEKLKAIPEIEKKLVQLPKEMKNSYAIAVAGTDRSDRYERFQCDSERRIA